MRTRKIRVCHLVPSFLLGDGPSSGILAQIRNQDSLRFEFSIWSLYAPDPARDPSAILDEFGFEHRTFNMRSCADLTIVPQLTISLRRSRFDILHCHLVRANLYGRFAGRLAAVPVVINTLRNVEHYMQSRRVFDKAVRAVERATISLVTRYVAVSEAVREAAIHQLGLSPAKVETILNAVEIQDGSAESGAAVRDRLGIPRNAFVVGSVGRLHPQKNVPRLINAASELVRSFHDLFFIVVGEGDDRTQLERQIHERGLGNRFLLPGFVSNVPEYLQAMDVFVLASIYEGLPRALMEAMAAGKAVVVTDAGGNKELVEDGKSGIVVSSSGSSLEEEIAMLLRSTETRKRLGQAAGERIRNLFGAKRMASQYDDLYLRLLKERSEKG